MSTAVEIENRTTEGATEFLRSVNIVYDIDEPHRIGHFHPTTKSIPLIESLAISQSTDNYLIVAPYGSGKSLLATFVAQLVENTEAGALQLRKIVDRIPPTAVELQANLSDRISVPQIVRPSGIAVVLSGYQPNLGEAIADSFLSSLKRIGLDGTLAARLEGFQGGVEEVLQLLGETKHLLEKEGAAENIEPQRIVLLWDEFGRHLEDLVSTGDAAKLADIQLIAEYAARQQKVPVALALFLHQGLANYASNLSQSARKEWRKIEGRFETVQFVDDSREIIRLIADIVRDNRPESRTGMPISVNLEDTIDTLTGEDVGLFGEFDRDELDQLLKDAYPLEPAALYLLPRVSARVAQNERTLFSFLFAMDMRATVSPETLFDYFADSMMTDTGIGGAYHHWLEIQNAIEKTTDARQVPVLKTAGLLGLGISGHRSRVGKALLVAASTGYRMPLKQAERVIQDLVERRLLLYRKGIDQVAVWHGVDIDLRGRLEQEKVRIGLSFDFVSFLAEELPPKAWMPLEYNADFQMSRYFKSAYASFSSLDSALQEAAYQLDNGIDGYIVHLLPDENEDIGSMLAKLKAMEIADRIIVTVPQQPIQLIDTALEVYTLRRMQEDDALVAEDPLVLPQLKQMTDDTLDYLRRIVAHAIFPRENGPYWFGNDSIMVFREAPGLRTHLSDLSRRIFSETPRFNNELIVRNHPRQVIINARKKLIGAILDHHGEVDLGLEGYRPDRSMFRTILLSTGLYREKNGRWGFAQPKELADKNLAKVWNAFRILLSKKRAASKDLEAFFDHLFRPPIGLRPGVYSILLAAALRAFPSSLSITENGDYVEDILPSTIENMCERPWSFDFRVLRMNPETAQFLSKLQRIFCREGTKTAETDLLRLTFDALQRWISQLPPAGLTSRKVSKRAAQFRVAISRMNDPVDLFFKKIPTIFGFSSLSDTRGIKRLRAVVREIEKVVDLYFENAESTLQDALQLRGNGDICEGVHHWIQYIPESAIKGMPSSKARAFHSRLSFGYDEPRLLLNSIASVLVDKTINRWDDSTLTLFDRTLRSAVNQLEEYALQTAKDSPELSRDLAGLATSRIRSLYKYLVDVVGNADAAKSLQEILAEEVPR
jgi:hypothetical protein